MFSQFIKLKVGEPPLFEANHAYKIIAWGELDNTVFVFFSNGQMVLSSPVENLQEPHGPGAIAELKSNLPQWPMKPLPPCSR